MSDGDYICDLIIDHVVELLGRRYRKSEIKMELAKINGGNPLNFRIVNTIISKAKAKIRTMYGIDPVEFKGLSVEFYQSIIRNEKSALRSKIRCCENLDRLLGLEHLTADDPTALASKIAEAIKAMDETVQGKDPNDQSENPSNEVISQDPQPTSAREEESHEDNLKEALGNVELKDDGSLKNK